MAVIPGYQIPLSGYQIAGQAIREGGDVFGKMAALIEKRKQNLIQQRNDEIEAERKKVLREREDEKYKREQEELKRKDEFRDWAVKGKEERLPGPATQTGEYPTTNIPYEPEEILKEGVRRTVYDPLEYAKSQATGRSGVTVTTDAAGNLIRVPQTMGTDPEYVTIGDEKIKKGFAPQAPIKGGDYYYRYDPTINDYVKTNVQTPDVVKNKIAYARLNLDKKDLEIKEAQLKNKLTEEQAQKNFKLGDATAAIDRLSNSANEIKNDPALWRITGWVGSLWDLPGSDAADLRAKLETLESQIAFGVLQNMRDASKTGGALGAVSEREIEFLKNNLAALKTSQSPEAFAENLQKIVDFANDSKLRMTNAYNDSFGGVQPTQPPEKGKETPAQKVAKANAIMQTLGSKTELTAAQKQLKAWAKKTLETNGN